MIVCQECGNAAPSTDGFCSSCGALLEWAGEPVAAAPALPPLAAPVEPATAAVQPAAVQSAAAAVKPDEEAIRPAPVPLMPDPGYDGLFCSHCGTRNADGRVFCRYCGQALDLIVAARARRRWWQRLLHRRGQSAPLAGDRPRDFRRRDVAGADGASTKKRRRFHLPSRLPLSRFAPILVVLGLVGIGIGPGRQWITQRFDGLIGRAEHRIHASYVPVVPTAASASSSGRGHKASLVIDGVKQTWWQSADHPDGIGESVTIRFPNPVNLDRIGLLSGVGGDKYRTQARPRTMTVTADGKPAGQVSFKDSADFQTASVSLRSVRSVTIVVTAAYPGQHGHDVAVRELQFFELQ